MASKKVTCNLTVSYPQNLDSGFKRPEKAVRAIRIRLVPSQGLNPLRAGLLEPGPRTTDNSALKTSYISVTYWRETNGPHARVSIISPTETCPSLPFGSRGV